MGSVNIYISTKLAGFGRELDAIVVYVKRCCSAVTGREQHFALLLNLLTLPTMKHMLPRRNVALIYAVACKEAKPGANPPFWPQCTQPLPAKTEIS